MHAATRTIVTQHASEWNPKIFLALCSKTLATPLLLTSPKAVTKETTV